MEHSAYDSLHAAQCSLSKLDLSPLAAKLLLLLFPGIWQPIDQSGDTQIGRNGVSQDRDNDVGCQECQRQHLPDIARTVFADNPAWDSIAQNQNSLIFVGFGYNVIAGDKVGIGIKREGSWIISVVENRRVGFSVEGKSTCSGDSGGPAYFETDAALLLAAVTSAGNDDCSIGYETRVDAYSTWLAGRMR